MHWGILVTMSFLSAHWSLAGNTVEVLWCSQYSTALPFLPPFMWLSHWKQNHDIHSVVISHLICTPESQWGQIRAGLCWQSYFESNAFVYFNDSRQLHGGLITLLSQAKWETELFTSPQCTWVCGDALQLDSWLRLQTRRSRCSRPPRPVCTKPLRSFSQVCDWVNPLLEFIHVLQMSLSHPSRFIHWSHQKPDRAV